MAKKSRQLEIVFPTAGLVKSTAYQSMPPYATPDCQNVRPFDPLETRQRGGSRPGLSKSFSDHLGQGIALVTNGTNQYLSVADNAALSMGDVDMTVGAWVYITDKSQYAGIMGKWTTGTDLEWVLTYHVGTDRFAFLIRNTADDTTTNVVANNLGSPSINTWYFIMAWHDAAANAGYMCVNDGDVDSTATTGGILDGGANFEVGRYDTSFYWPGRIARAFVYKSKVFTSDERTFMYNSGIGRKYSECGVAGTDGADLTAFTGYWEFEDDSSLGDDSTGTTDLTPNNTPTQGTGPGGEPFQALASVSIAEDDGTIRDVLLAISRGVLYYTDSAGDFQSPEVETVLIGESINNGYFETLGAGGADVFGTWTETAGSGAVAYETAYRNSGAYSAKLSYVTGAADIHQDVTVTPGANCTLSFWARGDGTEDGEYLLYDVTHTQDLGFQTNTGVTGTTWTKIAVDFTVPDGCTSLRVYLISPDAAGSAWFDDVRLTHRVSTATAVFSTSKNRIPVCGLNQKFYISDRSDTDISGTEGVVTSSVLSDYSVSDWTALGIDTDVDFVAITSTQLDELDVTRSIDFATSSYIVLQGDAIAEGPASYTVNRKDRSGDSGYCDQKFYMTDTSVTNWLTEGLSIGGVIGTDEPDFYQIIAIEQDRVWLDAAPTGPVEWWGYQSDGTNLISNPSFETAGAGPPACLNWSESGTVVQSTTESYVGSYSARLDGSSSTYIYQQVTISAQSEYIFTFRIKSSSNCQYRVYDNDNTADIVAATSFAATGDWQFVAVGFTTPAGCTSVNVYVYGSDAAVYAYVDDASLMVTTSHGTAGTSSSPYVLFDADVADWTDYGIDNDTDSFSYTDATPTAYDASPSGISSIGLLFDVDLTGTEPFDWVVSRLDYEGDDGLLTTANSKSRFSASSLPDLDSLTLADDDSVSLTRPEKTFTSGVYPIASVASGGVTLDTSEVPDGSEYLYQLGRKIQVFDPDTGVLKTLEETDGTQPLNCSILTTFRGRLVGVYKNTWYMARINDPLDWDYGADDQDTARAIAGGVAEAGDVPDPVTAAFPHTDDYFLFGCHGSMWLMRGDPGSGAEIDPISHEVGIVGPQAWCHLDDGTLAFLSRAGVYLFAAGGGGYPVPFSQKPLPEELINIDGESNFVSLGYDFVHRGICVFTTPTGGTTGDHWWIDWRSDEVKPLCPDSFPDRMQATAVLPYAADPTDPKRVLFGCFDGYLREFDPTASTDDGETITSYVVIGPIRLAQGGHVGLVTGISGVLDEDSDDVSWALRIGNTGEAAVDASSSQASGTWSASWNYPASDRVSGAVGVLYVSSTGQWALERIDLTLSPGGRLR